MDTSSKQRKFYAKKSIGIIVEKIPEEEIRALAITLLECARKFYEDPENVKLYEEWRKNRKKS